MNIALKWLANAAAILIAAYVLPGVAVAGIFPALVLAIVLGVLNVFIKPLLVLLTLPLTIISLGLFTFVINALLVLLASEIVKGFSVQSFWWALLFSFVLSLVTSFFNILDKDK